MAIVLRRPSFDGVAMSLSGLCLVHCLALPVLAASLPFLAVFAEAEWVHILFVALAIPISGIALFGAARRGGGGLILGALTGLGLLTAGAAGWPAHDYETLLTVTGGLVLATVHALNGRWARQSHAHP